MKKQNEERKEQYNFKPTEQSFPRFHSFKDEPVFIGWYKGEYVKEHLEIDCFEFEDLDGFPVLINKTYQIKQAIEKYKSVLYKIEFVGKKVIKGGRSVNEFKILVDETSRPLPM